MRREYQETWFIVVDENREILGNMQTDSVDMFTDNTVGEFLTTAKLGLPNILRDRDSGNLKVYVDIQSGIPLPEDTPVGGYGYLYEDPLVIFAPRQAKWNVSGSTKTRESLQGSIRDKYFACN